MNSIQVILTYSNVYKVNNTAYSGWWLHCKSKDITLFSATQCCKGKVSINHSQTNYTLIEVYFEVSAFYDQK